MATNIFWTLFACACIGVIAGSLVGFYFFAAPVAGGAIGAGALVVLALLRNLAAGK